MPDQDAQLLAALERLLEAPATDLRVALTHSADVIADALGADKVDAFLYDESRDSLVAVGASTQPLSELQRRLGLDVLPLSNGGRGAHVYRTGEPFRTGELLHDPEELRGIREGMKIQSAIAVPLDVVGQRRGVVTIASLQADDFTAADEAFAQSVAHWVGSVVHRAELIQEIERSATERGRRASAEELVTVLAHDLRNHLSPVVSHLYALRHRAEADGRADELRSIDAAQHGLSTIGSLVTDLLDVARIDRGLFALDREVVDLAAIAKETARSLSTNEHEIIVHAESVVVALGDSRRIRQCLQNVLTNAVDHSPRGAPVHVIVSRSSSAGESWAQLEIKDEGPGIPPEVLPHIFERFRTARREAGGLGLGLYLAKQVALLHGGDLTVADDSPSGTRFLLRLPGHSS